MGFLAIKDFCVNANYDALQFLKFTHYQLKEQ
jgi:hypothetical protein